MYKQHAVIIVCLVLTFS